MYGTCVHVRVLACARACMCARMRACACACMCGACVYVRVHVRACACVHVRAHVRMNLAVSAKSASSRTRASASRSFAAANAASWDKQTPRRLAQLARDVGDVACHRRAAICCASPCPQSVGQVNQIRPPECPNSPTVESTVAVIAPFPGVGALRARARPSTPTPLGARTLRVLGNHRPQGAGAPSLPKPFRARTLRAIQIKRPQGALRP